MELDTDFEKGCSWGQKLKYIQKRSQSCPELAFDEKGN